MDKKQGSPVRHPIEWQKDSFYDEKSLDEELRRVFDICHGCRRCFNLCDTFPRLFTLIDDSQTGEIESVSSKDFGPVVEACTLCDLCFSNKCPYVPPHEYNIDFPHLMLRYRAVERHEKGGSFVADQLAQTDRNGKLGSALAPVANWALDSQNKLGRTVLKTLAGIHPEAELPAFQKPHFLDQEKEKGDPLVNKQGPGYGQKVALYATCYMTYQESKVGRLAREILALNGVETVLFYPECCGMPHFELGNVKEVSEKAERVALAAAPFLDQGYEIVSLVPSCSLMIKSEWPLLWPENPLIQKLADSTKDISEYLADLARDKGLTPGLRPLEKTVTLQMACHARAQNKGRQAEKLLNLIPQLQVNVLERCSGHGGVWGTKTENFPVALKVGSPVVKKIQEESPSYVTSECPLAGKHIYQGLSLSNQGEPLPQLLEHPLELLALAYGIE